MSWSSDGRHLLFFRNTPDTFADLWILPLIGERKPYPYLNTVNAESAGRFSPDSHWRLTRPMSRAGRKCT